jgi:hypothetical protein
VTSASTVTNDTASTAQPLIGDYQAALATPGYLQKNISAALVTGCRE